MSKEIVEQLKSKLEPESVLVVYRDNQDYYIESHLVKKGKIQSGVPFSKDALKKIANAFDTEGKTTYRTKLEILPEELIAFRNEVHDKVLVWRVKGCVRTLSINKKKVKTRVPNMIFIVRDKNLRVYVEHKLNTAKEVQLFYAPFYNIYEDGKVCMGNVNIANFFDSIADEMNWWEGAFFNSVFTHTLYETAQKPLVEIWKIEKPDLFTYLKPLDKTLKQLLEKL